MADPLREVHDILLLLLDMQIKASEHMVKLMIDLESLKATVCALDPGVPEILQTNLLSTRQAFEGVLSAERDHALMRASVSKLVQ